MDLRRNLMSQAIRECYKEMYSKAQPKADFDALIEGKKNGTIIDTNEDPIYRRYYLSMEEFTYIRDKYVEKYRFSNEWKSNIDFLKECLTKGGLRDTFETHSNGEQYRSAEKVAPLANIIGQEAAAKVINLINDYQDFYHFDKEEGDFGCAVALGASPNSNKEAVEKYWREHGIPDFTIEDRDPESFWYRDEYGEDWERIMKEEYDDSDDSEN